MDTPIASEGQRLLRELPGSLGVIAEALGASRQAVSTWRRGDRLPGRKARKRICDVYGIPVDAWARRPGTAPSGPTELDALAPLPPIEPGTLSTLDAVRRLVADIDHRLADPGLSEAAWLKLTEAKMKSLAIQARLERDEEFLEDRIVHEHPAWHRLRAAMLAALEPYPDAARAMAEAITEAGAA